MSAIGTSAVVFLVLASVMGLVFLAALKLLNGKEFRFTAKSAMLTLLVPLVIGLGVIGIAAFLEVHEQPPLCGEYCHAMGPVYDTYLNPGNNSVMSVHADAGVTCLDCHTGPGLRGQVDVYVAVPHEAYYEVTDKFDTDDLGGDVEPDFCLKCHDGERASLPAEVTTTVGTLVDPHGREADCADCHRPHQPGLGLSDETCALCHGTTIKDFEVSLQEHGVRVGEDCNECHNREHPEDAQISWKTVPFEVDQAFCSDCHVAIVAGFNSSQTEYSQELYGDCTDCHHDHNVSLPPHVILPGHEDCQVCHVNFGYEALMHNRTGVTYLGVDGLTDEFCGACHEDQGRTMPSLHESVACTSCHSDHKLRVEFDDCTECHDDDVPTWHDPTTTGCWYSDCHGDWFYHR